MCVEPVSDDHRDVRVLLLAAQQPNIYFLMQSEDILAGLRLGFRAQVRATVGLGQGWAFGSDG